MEIAPSYFVDNTGLVKLPYLSDWKHVSQRLIQCYHDEQTERQILTAPDYHSEYLVIQIDLYIFRQMILIPSCRARDQ